MRALFRSQNLIGDSLYIQPALAAWAAEHVGWEVDLLTLKDHVSCLYEGMQIPNLRVVFEREGEYDFEFNFDVNIAFSIGDKEKVHIAEAYAKMLGVAIPTKLPVYQPPEGEAEKNLFLLSMFSNSCASNSGHLPNKIISWGHWLYILALLRQCGKIGILGGPNDHALLPARQDEYYLGLPLPQVARMLRSAKMLVSIDNGLAHLAATQGTPTVLYYPACLGRHWIVPPSPRVVYVQVDPVTLHVADAVRAVREGIRRFVR